MKKPPLVLLEFGVNSKARSLLFEKLDHFSQNSTVSLLVPERLSAALAASLLPSKEPAGWSRSAGKGAGAAQGRAVHGGGGFAADAVGKAGSGGLGHAPVVDQAGGRADRAAVVALHFEHDSGGPGGAGVVGDPQADRPVARGREGFAGRRGGAGIRLVAAVAVEVPFVFGDRAVGVARGRGVEARRRCRPSPGWASR